MRRVLDTSPHPATGDLKQRHHLRTQLLVQKTEHRAKLHGHSDITCSILDRAQRTRDSTLSHQRCSTRSPTCNAKKPCQFLSNPPKNMRLEQLLGEYTSGNCHCTFWGKDHHSLCGQKTFTNLPPLRCSQAPQAAFRLSTHLGPQSDLFHSRSDNKYAPTNYTVSFQHRAVVLVPNCFFSIVIPHASITEPTFLCQLMRELKQLSAQRCQTSAISKNKDTFQSSTRPGGVSTKVHTRSALKHQLANTQPVSLLD